MSKRIIRTTGTHAAWTAIDWSRHMHDARVNGRRLRYVDFGTGRPTVLVHGLGGSWQTWLENLPALGTHNRLIAVDLPGFGASARLRHPAAMDDHVKVLVELLDQLGLEDVAVVGHSMGGLISMRLAIAHPHRVTALVLVSSGGIRLRPAQLALLKRGFGLFNALFGLPYIPRAAARRPRLRRLVLRAFMTDPSTLSPELAAEVIPAMHAPGFKTAITEASRVALSTNPADVSCPTLVIWGERDRILPVAAARELIETMPDARLTVLDDVGHCPMFERPGAFNSLVAKFIADQPKTAEYAEQEPGR